MMCSLSKSAPVLSAPDPNPSLLAEGTKGSRLQRNRGAADSSRRTYPAFLFQTIGLGDWLGRGGLLGRDGPPGLLSFRAHLMHSPNPQFRLTELRLLDSIGLRFHHPICRLPGAGLPTSGQCSPGVTLKWGANEFGYRVPSKSTN